MKHNLKKQLLIILFTVIFLLIYILVFYKPSDQKAYNEVIATMSMEKAKHFFYDYPDSRFKDILVNQIVEWCQQEKNEECYKIILETIPKDHVKYKELSSYYNEQFKADK